MDKEEGIIVIPEWGAVGWGGENLGNTGSKINEMNTARPAPPPPPERGVERGGKKGGGGGGLLQPDSVMICIFAKPVAIS